MSVSHAELSCISQMGRVEKHTPWEDPPPPLPLNSSTFCFGLSLFYFAQDAEVIYRAMIKSLRLYTNDLVCYRK